MQNLQPGKKLREARSACHARLFPAQLLSRTATRSASPYLYDQLRPVDVEYGADLAGLHLLDRFVGCLEPIFRSSRLDIDMHYNPPGIRGEPRYLEGVVRLTKLHGSLDWVYRNSFVRKVGLPFGPQDDHPAINDQPSDSVMILPELWPRTGRHPNTHTSSCSAIMRLRSAARTRCLSPMGMALVTSTSTAPSPTC